MAKITMDDPMIPEVRELLAKYKTTQGVLVFPNETGEVSIISINTDLEGVVYLGTVLAAMGNSAPPRSAMN